MTELDIVETVAAARTPRLRMVCAKCGSEDVLCDAYAQWSVERQEWEIANTFDKGAHCSACDGECRIDEEEIEEPEVPDYLRPLLED